MAGLGAGAAVVAGGAMAWATRDRSLERIHARGAIRVGYSVEPPYAFPTREGDVTGESPETARWVVKEAGLGDIVWHQTEFGALLDELQAGEFDVVAAGMFATEGRAARVTFSVPTLRVRPGLLVAKGNPLGLHSHDDLLRHPQARVALLAGSVEESALLQMGLPSGRMISVPDALAGRVAVSTGNADALPLSAPTIRWMASQREFKAVELAEPFLPPAGAGALASGEVSFAFRQDDVRLRAAWDVALRRLVGSPAHLQLLERFGLTAQDLPPFSGGPGLAFR